MYLHEVHKMNYMMGKFVSNCLVCMDVLSLKLLVVCWSLVSILTRSC